MLELEQCCKDNIILKYSEIKKMIKFLQLFNNNLNTTNIFHNFQIQNILIYIKKTFICMHIHTSCMCSFDPIFLNISANC